MLRKSAVILLLLSLCLYAPSAKFWATEMDSIYKPYEIGTNIQLAILH